VQGAALLARRHFVDEVGPLCEDYFFFLEETDWCWRARAAGWQVVHIPGAGLVHELGASSKRPYPGPTAIEYHRSLYRFLRERRGRVTWAVCAVARLGRAAFGAVVLSLAGVVSARQRRRAVGRRAVLLWHLRGCPEGAGLADAVPLDA
jgi:GT2 family glycosyltransferase